jgi:undecaprenyl-diphosphatase
VIDFSNLMDLDARLTARARVAERPGPVRSLAGLLAHSGDSWFWIVGLAALWATRMPYWHARARLMLLGIIVTALVVLGLKFTVRRKRPEGTWGGIYRKSDPHSFPSGHAARATMLAVLALGVGPAWFGVALLVWAPLVASARVVMGVHYLSDVLAGMGLGIALGLLFLRFIPFGGG